MFRITKQCISPPEIHEYREVLDREVLDKHFGNYYDCELAYGYLLLREVFIKLLYSTHTSWQQNKLTMLPHGQLSIFRNITVTVVSKYTKTILIGTVPFFIDAEIINKNE